jgi:hypothetical protein
VIDFECGWRLTHCRVPRRPGNRSKKRWLCKAVLESDHYRAHAPTVVGDYFGLLKMVKATAIVGFDFPIGIPIRYADLLGIADFKSFLVQLGGGDFADF